MSDFPDPPLPPWSAALFLDLDGTLAPLAPRPEDVRLDAPLLDSLRLLQERLGGALALISGRPIAQLDALVAPLRLPAAGVHGAQRRDAAGRLHAASGEPPASAQAVAARWVTRHPSLRLELKPAAFALHFRAAPELGPDCARAVRDALRDEPAWEAIDGHCVVEVRARGVHKGQALEAFLDEAPFAGRQPVFIGDDVTDEDAIAAAQARGGLGIKVGAGATAAQHRLADPVAVGRWLARWATAPAGPDGATEGTH